MGRVGQGQKQADVCSYHRKEVNEERSVLPNNVVRPGGKVLELDIGCCTLTAKNMCKLLDVRHAKLTGVNTNGAFSRSKPNFFLKWPRKCPKSIWNNLPSRVNIISRPVSGEEKRERIISHKIRKVIAVHTIVMSIANA